MGLLHLASGASTWRGYEYYKGRRVLSMQRISEHEYKGIVKGSGYKQYAVFIDLAHPRKSHCNCPHANGRRIICKHLVALYFSAFPKQAEQYYEEVVAYEEEQERYQEEIDCKVAAYINSLSKEKLRQTLYEVLYDGADWVFERFVREHIDDA